MFPTHEQGEIKEIYKRKGGSIISENLIIVLSIVAIVAITTIAFVALVSLNIYFTEKKIVAGYKSKTEVEGIKTESNVSIEAVNDKEK